MVANQQGGLVPDRNYAVGLLVVLCIWLCSGLASGQVVSTVPDYPLDYPIVMIRGANGPIRNAEMRRQGPYEIRERWLALVNVDGTVEHLDGPWVIDRCVDPYDANTVYYSKRVQSDFGGFINVVTSVNLYKINVTTREITLLVDSREHYAPLRAHFRYDTQPQTSWQVGNQRGLLAHPHGAWATAPAIIGDRMVFVANWSYLQTKEAAQQSTTVLQLYACDKDTGENIDKIGFMNLGGVDHPAALKNGRVAFMTNESQGVRYFRWGIWSVTCDGGAFAPEVSAMDRHVIDTLAPHRIAPLRGESWAFEDYYANRMVGTIRGVGSNGMQGTTFGPPMPGDNVPIRDGYGRGTVIQDGQFVSGGMQQSSQYGFQPIGMFAITPWATAQDWDPATIDGEPVGEWAMPAPDPNGGMLAMRRTNNSEQGVYLVTQIPATDHSLEDVVRVIDEPGVAELAPYPLLTWEEIYGQPPPAPVKYERDLSLPPGSPYARAYMGSVRYRENEVSRSLQHQGGDVADYETDDIEYFMVWVTQQRPFVNSFQRQLGVGNIINGGDGHQTFLGWANMPFERLTPFEVTTPDGVTHPGIPVKKYRRTDGQVHHGPNPPPAATLILGTDGEADSSLTVDLPADVPLMFVLGDKDGRNLSVGQTWHHFRPREKVTSCIGGCHLHHAPSPISWPDTFAASSEGITHRLSQNRGVTEYYRDVEPLLQRCFSCHDGTDTDRLNLQDPWVWTRFQGSPLGVFSNDLTRGYQALRSVVYQRAADQHSPSPLTPAELDTLGDWIDEGLLFRNGNELHAYADSIAPTLHLEHPQRGDNAEVDRLVMSVLDTGAGVNLDDVRVTLDGEPYTGTWSWDSEGVGTSVLAAPLAAGPHAWSVSVSDLQPNLSGDGTRGNVTELTRTFTVTGDSPPAPPDPPDQDLEAQLAACLLEKEQLEAELAAALLDAAAKGDRIAELEAGLDDLAAQIEELRGN